MAAPTGHQEMQGNVYINEEEAPSFTYYINYNALEWVDTFKYLGTIVDNKLKWQAQITETVSKASSVLHLLRWTMNVWSTEAKKKAYTARVRPLLEYATPIWSPHQQGDIATLEKVQKRATRCVYGAR